jgi:hypothetical protein
VLNIGFLTTKARGSSPQFQAKIDRLEYRGRQEIGCTPERFVSVGAAPCFPQHHHRSAFRTGWRFKRPDAKNVRSRFPR